MNRFFNSAALIIPLILAPFTGLLILSQNTVPGDLLYPYKRGVEIMILAAASLHPTTKAYFHTDLADRRYNEAEVLLLAKRDVTALETFLAEVRETETAIANVSDITKKEELEETLITKIDDYQSRLTEVETQIANNQVSSPVGGSSQNQEVQTPFSEAPTPTIRTTNPTTAISQPTRSLTRLPEQPTPIPTQLEPIHVVQPTVPPTAPSTAEVSGAIVRTKDELEEIKEKVKKEREEKRREMEKQKEQEVEKQERENKEERKEKHNSSEKSDGDRDKNERNKKER